MTQRSSPAKRGLPPHPSDPSSLPVASPPARLTGPQADTSPAALAPQRYGWWCSGHHVEAFGTEDKARHSHDIADWHACDGQPLIAPLPSQAFASGGEDVYGGQDFKRADTNSANCKACGHHFTAHQHDEEGNELPDGGPCAECAAQGTSCPRFR